MRAAPLDRQSIACLIYRRGELVKKVETNKKNRIEAQPLRTEKDTAVCYKKNGIQFKGRGRARHIQKPGRPRSKPIERMLPRSPPGKDTNGPMDAYELVQVLRELIMHDHAQLPKIRVVSYSCLASLRIMQQCQG